MSDDLDQELGEHRTEIRTDQWSASIGELFSLYERRKLRVNPVFQRFFRWSEEQRSLLVESVLLGFPVPPLFLAQNEDGVLEVVDGVQRLSTLLQLRGFLRGEDDASMVDPLVLTSGQYLKSLAGTVWSEGVRDTIAGGEELHVFSEAQRSDIEFAKLDATIIQRASSGQSKYDVFRRLNSYGEPLTPQETRAALIASVNSDCLTWLASMARDSPAAELLALSERQIERQYDVELVLRFFFLVERDELRTSELEGFARVLDDYGTELASEFPSDRTRALGDAFLQSLQLVSESGGSSIFRRYHAASDEFKGPFLNTSFEALGTAIGFHLFRQLPVRNDLVQVAREFWAQDQLAGRFATGRSTEWRISTYVPLGRQLVGRVPDGQ